MPEAPVKRILASLAALFLIPCLPLAFVAVSQAASPKNTTETDQKREAVPAVAEKSDISESNF